MTGYFALLLHAHLPFVRHREHDRFLEESWLYEAITETYLPLLALLRDWERDRLAARLTLCLSPTLCAMWRDPLLRARYARRLAELLELAEKECWRTLWTPEFRVLAEFYRARWRRLQAVWQDCDGDLVTAFRERMAAGQLELITCAATHAVLPLLAQHTPALRGQIFTARDAHYDCFGQAPVGIWLPECAYAPELEPVLEAARLRWFVLDTHGLLLASPPPVSGPYAPVFTPRGLAAFGRDPASAAQVWSRKAGYPGDPRYRDFYRDAGYDLDQEYVRPHWPSPDARGFTGLKYHAIAPREGGKAVYDRAAALAASREHARHFLGSRQRQLERVAALLPQPPLVVAPYDAELFGHWWFEGWDFLDEFVRAALAATPTLEFLTPTDYLRRHPTHQVAQPNASSWGQEGYWQVWLNSRNAWLWPHLRLAQERFTELVRHHLHAEGPDARALRQAARELLLAQASDWPFLLHTGTAAAYARQRVTAHLSQFLELAGQLEAQRVDETRLGELEAQSPLFPRIQPQYWA